MLFAELCAAFSHTSKHAQHEVHHLGQTPYLMEILEAVAGGADQVKSRKLFSMVYCTLPPLRHETEMCEAYLELLSYEIPIVVLPMNAPGSTGPASLRSNLALANAEALSSFCLFQLAKPGTPMLYACSQGGTNFSDGGFMTGSPEASLLNAAAVEMAHHYGLPCAASGCTSEGKNPGGQVIMEKMQSLMPAFLAGPDLMIGLGEMDSAQLLVLEQILIDYELVRHCQRLKEGLDFDESKDFFSDIKKVGAGGNFFALLRTAKMCRSAEFLPVQLCHRGSYAGWERAGGLDLRARAREKVKQILAAPLVDPLSDEVLGVFEKVLAKMASDKSLT
jgi:trimethylamine--corrinoid protein Co-methyltransferase